MNAPDVPEVPGRVAHRRRRVLWAAGLVAAGAIGAGVVVMSLPASAQNAPTAAVSAAPSGRPDGSRGDARGPGGGQRPDETLLTGADAEKAKAAALKAVPGATVDRVETDADGAVYEAHITRSDGTRATVKFDQDFTVTGIETGGPGGGGPGRPGGPHATPAPSPTS